MPTLTIDATTEQLNRVKTALGLSTNAEVKTWIIDTVKREVKAKETEAVAEAEEAKRTALEAKQAEADVELT